MDLIIEARIPYSRTSCGGSSLYDGTGFGGYDLHWSPKWRRERQPTLIRRVQHVQRIMNSLRNWPRADHLILLPLIVSIKPPASYASGGINGFTVGVFIETNTHVNSTVSDGIKKEAKTKPEPEIDISADWKAKDWSKKIWKKPEVAVSVRESTHLL